MIFLCERCKLDQVESTCEWCNMELCEKCIWTHEDECPENKARENKSKMKYPKIETLYERDRTSFKVMTGKLRLPEFGLIKEWLVTEKIDGMNMRVELFDGSISYKGRTDNAQIPPHLLRWLEENLPLQKVTEAFDPGTNAVLFGEGYGLKIQKGGNYRDEGVSFRLFDIVVLSPEGHAWWLNWEDVEDVAVKLGVKTVPIFARKYSIDDAVNVLRLKSIVSAEEKKIPGEFQQEGIVCRTDPLLFRRDGSRLMWKLKAKDFE